MQVFPLAEQEMAKTGFTHAVKITYEDLTDTAATTKTLAIYPEEGTFSAGTYCLRTGLKLVTAFDASDTGINSLLVEVGDGGSTARLMPQTQIAADGTEITDFVTSNNTTSLPYAYVSADTIDAKFTVAGGASPLLSELTSGEVWLLLQVADLDQMVQT